MSEAVAVVLAGGKGQRLWPLSRESRPKQFVPVITEESLIATTVARLLSVFPKERIYISTSERYFDDVLAAGTPVPASNIILERHPAGPATAFALAAAVIGRLHGEDARMFSCPSDHFLQNAELFEQTLQQLVDGVFDSGASVIALGATPKEPDDRLGYFRLEPTATPEVFRVSELTEKPDIERARELQEQGAVCWNTAYYLARPVDVRKVFEQVHPEQSREIQAYAETWAKDLSSRVRGYEGLAVDGHELAPFLEVGAEITALVRDFGWSDVGTWERVLQVRDREANASPAVMPGSREVVAISTDGRPIVACGVEDLIIVSHRDAVYVMKRSAAEAAETISEWRSMVMDAGEGGLL